MKSFSISLRVVISESGLSGLNAVNLGNLKAHPEL
jgi:hypothetical protein